jgi:hypothetical protein
MIMTKKHKKLYASLFALINILGFIASCSIPKTNEESKKILQNVDTLVFANNYKIVIGKNNELIQVLKIENKDSLNLVFYDNAFNIIVNSSEESKKYFFSNRHGLHKFKNYITIKNFKYLQNQIIYFDTLSSNFLISGNSQYINLESLRDTVRLNESLNIRVSLLDSVFDKFRVCIISPENQLLDFDETHCTRKILFYNKKGCFDKVTFNKKGVFYYQGFVENYTNIGDTAHASQYYFFRKKIYVK